MTDADDIPGIDEKATIIKLFGKYRRLYNVEQPDIRFEEIFEIELMGREEFQINIDPLFLEVCEPNSVEVVGLMPSSPALVGAEVLGETILFKTKKISTQSSKIPESIRVTINGIRRGCAARRFEISDAREAKRNSFFYTQQKKIIEAGSVY
jgi:hypothetical protein